jgi:hypothetical protein
MRLCFPEYLAGMPYEQDELPRQEVIEQEIKPTPKPEPAPIPPESDVID